MDLVTATLVPSDVAPAPRRGRLRIYFGACAGVGKTSAMLLAGRALQGSGRSVVIGAVSPHGCVVTAALCDTLQRLDGAGEFALDQALALHPSLLLIDQIAHTNAAGARHPKRWHDIEEVLGCGIDVFTTASLQDWESLNDAVAGITGVRVIETVPDTLFDSADEVVLIDLPVDEILLRLQQRDGDQLLRSDGKESSFFNRGALTALRELALRRAADRVEDEVHAFREGHRERPVWKTGAAVLACVGPHPDAEHLVRSAARLAIQMNGGWHAIFVDTPQLRQRSPAHRERILTTLKLAQSLGASTAVLSADDVARAIDEYARRHNFSKVMLGCRPKKWPWSSGPGHLKRIAERNPHLDLIRIGRPILTQPPDTAAPAAVLRNALAIPWRQYLWGAIASVVTAAVAMPLATYLDPANIAMLFLLSVMLVAIRLGRAASVVTTLTGVLAFDLLFVPPRFSLAISDPQYAVTIVVMVVVGLIAGHLTAGLHYQAALASEREARTRGLYDFARTLSAALMNEQVFETVETYVATTFEAHAVVLMPDQSGRIDAPAATAGRRSATIASADLALAQWCFEHGREAGAGTDTKPDGDALLLPLIAPMCSRGVLVIQLNSRQWLLLPEQRKQLETFAALVAIALERIHYVDVAQDALVRMSSERLRNSLLAALSHDLRTPLTSLAGLSESLTMSKPPLSAMQAELAEALRDEARRLGNLVANLMEMARIQSGQVRLNLQWQTLEEVVGTALRACRHQRTAHVVSTALAPDLPLVQFDAVLIERVFCNLLENAMKYTPAGARIVIAAQVQREFLQIDVSDDGPGIAAGQHEHIFEKFSRGERESAKPGVGLGLSICRAIVEAHGGAIRAIPATSGALFRFTLPLGTPPLIPAFDESGAEQCNATLANPT